MQRFTESRHPANEKLFRSNDRRSTFRVPDDTDIEDESADESDELEYPRRVLQDNGIRPTRNIEATIDLTSNDDPDAPVAEPSSSRCNSQVVDLTTTEDLRQRDTEAEDNDEPPEEQPVTEESVKISQGNSIPGAYKDFGDDIGLASQSSDNRYASDESSNESTSHAPISSSESDAILDDDDSGDHDISSGSEAVEDKDDGYEGFSSMSDESAEEDEGEILPSPMPRDSPHASQRDAITEVSSKQDGPEVDGTYHTNFVSPWEVFGHVEPDVATATGNGAHGYSSLGVAGDGEHHTDTSVPASNPQLTSNDAPPQQGAETDSYIPSHQPAHESPNPATYSFAAKAGKTDYFQAREENRRILGFPPRASPRRVIEPPYEFPIDTDVDAESQKALDKHSRMSAFSWDRPSSMLPQADPVITNTSLEDDDVVSEIAARAKSPALDESSHRSFQLRNEVEAAGSGETVLRKPSKLCIKDIIEVPVADAAAPAASKRKAEAISETTHEEERVFNLRQPSPTTQAADCVPANSGEAIPRKELAQAINPNTDSASSPLPYRPEIPRPTKRLRRAAEVFGYAAIGGIAVMSALIATAPAL